MKDPRPAWWTLIAVAIALSPLSVLRGVDTDSPVVLAPGEWIGEEFTLAHEIEDESVLLSGQWLVVLYHSGCPACRRALEDTIAVAETESLDVAVIEVPPGDEGELADLKACVARHLVLPASRNWIVTTPVVLRLDQGEVTDVDLGERSFADSESGSSDSLELARSVIEHGPVERVDLGYVERRSSHVARFRVTNPGARPMQVLGLEIGCACMKAIAPPEWVPPRSSAEIEIRFEAPDISAAYSKDLHVLTDDPERRSIPLTLRARIDLPLAVVPEVLELERTSNNQILEVAVEVRNDSQREVRILYATSDLPGLAARVPLDAIPPGGATNLSIVLKRVDRLAGSPLKAKLALRTNLPEQRTVELSVEIADVVEVAK